MTNNKAKDLKPKIFKTIITWALVTYIVQIVATITSQMFKGFDWQYQVIGFLLFLSMPALALLIGLIISKLRHQQNRLQFATIFAVSAYLLYLILQILLPYSSIISLHLGANEYYLGPILVALISQTLISILLTKQHNGIQTNSARWYFVALCFGVAITQAIQSIQMIPSIINFANVANITQTIVLPVALWAMLVTPVVFLSILILTNSLELRSIKNVSQRLFLACITSVFAFVIVNSLLSFSGIEPLHDISNLWICVISYIAAFAINGIITSYLRKQINNIEK